MGLALGPQQWWSNKYGLPKRSVRFNSADSAYLSRTPATAGNRKTWTWAGWVKLSAFDSTRYLLCATDNVTASTFVGFGSYSTAPANTLFFYIDGTGVVYTNAVYRDTSAWYHIVFAVDTTQATTSNRVKVYVNGQEQSLSGTYPNLNVDTQINSTSFLHTIASYYGASGFFNGYLADSHFIDGQALEPTAFGEFDQYGVWQPKSYDTEVSGPYGNNGFHLPFSDNSSASALGTDTSGNGNNWTTNNLSITSGSGNDSLVDVPYNYEQDVDNGLGGQVRGNYCSLNPLAKGSAATLSNGNLDISYTATQSSTLSTIGISSGKWYWEILITTVGGILVGIAKDPINLNTDYVGETAGSYGYFGNDGKVYNNASGSSVYATYTNNDIVGVAYDADNGKLYFSKNGAFINSGDPVSGTGFVASGLSGVFFPAIGGGLAGASAASANFGQRPFAYQAPAGFKCLCSTNLPIPTIQNGSTVMDVKLYTGNGSTQTISGLGFSPDLVWIKIRSGINDHKWTDTVRGATNYLESNNTGAEATQAGGVTAFNSDGFDVGNGSAYNSNNDTYAAWTWDAGSSTVTNNDGSITSSVRANPSAGFSIVTYTGNGSAGATIGHGLNAAPAMIIVKCRNVARNWTVGHQGIASDPWTDYLMLNSTAAAADLNTVWNDTAPTSTVFTVGTANGVNANTETHVAYCFAPVDGYSSFGSYTGNGSADGPFVFLNFRARWIMFKRVAAADPWIMYDTARSQYNQLAVDLAANDSRAEGATTAVLDITSNGFKLRNSGTIFNQSGSQYIYCAFAENPFKVARAR